MAVRDEDVRWLADLGWREGADMVGGRHISCTMSLPTVDRARGGSLVLSDVWQGRGVSGFGAARGCRPGGAGRSASGAVDDWGKGVGIRRIRLCVFNTR